MLIPVDAHLIHLLKPVFEFETRTVLVGKTPQQRRVRVEKVKEIPTKRTQESLQADLKLVNEIFAPASIEFQLRNCVVEKVQAPEDAEVVNANGFLFLAKEFPAGEGVSLLLVHQFASADLGGQAIEAQRVCVVGDAAPATSLAHEFGHLLNLAHEGDIRNLMNAGLSVPSPKLTPGQIKAAKASPLARRASPQAK